MLDDSQPATTPALGNLKSSSILLGYYTHMQISQNFPTYTFISI